MSKGKVLTSYQMNRETWFFASAVIKCAFKTSPEEAICELKRLCQCMPDSQKQNHSLLEQNHNWMHLLNPETGEIHTLERIHQGHNR